MYSLVAAIDQYNNIGHNGAIPWSCPEDMAHFRNLTKNSVVIMGSKTFESIGQALKHRVNIIISRKMTQESIKDGDVHVVSNPMEAVLLCEKKYRDIQRFVIGGAQIYTWFLDQRLITKAHITRITGPYLDGDTKLDLSKWGGVCMDTVPVQLASNAVYTIHTYRNHEELECLSVMRNILHRGNRKIDRTNVGTMSIFGRQLRFNLRNNTFPLMTTRKMFLRGIFAELMLYIRGQTNNQILEDQKISVWRGNTTREFLDSRGLHHMPQGDMGASYGFLFRHFGAKYNTCLDNYEGQGVDQLMNVINTIKTNPNDRRMIISLWDPANLNNCPLPPCLYNYQFYVHDGELSCMMTQRSSDFVVAGGWNIATGALLTYLLSNVCDLTPGELIWNLGDTHIYNNLVNQAEIQLQREPNLYPKIFIKKKENITDYEFTDVNVIHYNPHPSIEVVMNA